MGARPAKDDAITLITDLMLKGLSTALKHGTVSKAIHLTDDASEIEGRIDEIKRLVPRTGFLKTA